MKTLLNCLLVSFFGISLYASVPSPDWGVTGHRTVGAIAQANLKPKVAKIVDELLGGQSLAFVSTYADEIRSDAQYDKFAPWHYVNFPFDSAYGDHPVNEDGDVIQGIEYCVSVLKDEGKSREERAFYLKMLVHLVGDLHQPLHVGQADDRGGNRFYVKWFNESTNLHRLWDTQLIEHYNMSYTELAENQDRLGKGQIKAIQEASLMDWVNQSRTLCLDIYEHTEPDQKLSYPYAYQYTNVIRRQLQQAGLRLAALLNEVLG
ncbi:MAG: S1/P1 nuclease [Flavobacteriaceae bacterium]|nr:S1/P1 nuclease [Flavobacteriaceae bacterium]